ncbi:MAG: hypothetical protein QGI09_11410, partial [Dehalococcoidia bacterium]|nr:hypothetical protein [Dehalococcoidia bacterium]
MPRGRKKKTEPTLSRRDLAAQLKADINKRHKGRGIMMSGDEYEAPFMVVRRPSGIIDLDIACGGGLPPGMS